MDHKAYESKMIDGVNRHAEEKGKRIGKVKRVFTKADLSALKRGLKRTVIALITEIIFGLSVFSFIAAATASGYWAVILFISAIVLMVWSFIFLYAQGVADGESKGEAK